MYYYCVCVSVTFVDDDCKHISLDSSHSTKLLVWKLQERRMLIVAVNKAVAADKYLQPMHEALQTIERCGWLINIFYYDANVFIHSFVCLFACLFCCTIIVIITVVVVASSVYSHGEFSPGIQINNRDISKLF